MALVRIKKKLCLYQSRNFTISIASRLMEKALKSKNRYVKRMRDFCIQSSQSGEIYISYSYLHDYCIEEYHEECFFRNVIGEEIACILWQACSRVRCYGSRGKLVIKDLRKDLINSLSVKFTRPAGLKSIDLMKKYCMYLSGSVLNPNVSNYEFYARGLLSRLKQLTDIFRCDDFKTDLYPSLSVRGLKNNVDAIVSKNI